MGLIRFDPSALKRRSPIFSFCISKRASSLAGGGDGMQWLVLRRVRADYSSEWARWPAGIELTGALFFFHACPFLSTSSAPASFFPRGTWKTNARANQTQNTHTPSVPASSASKAFEVIIKGSLQKRHGQAAGYRLGAGLFTLFLCVS